jgi:hypothetical protein
MVQSRRSWLTNSFRAFGLLAIADLAGAQHSVSPQPLPSPNAPDAHAPGGLNPPPMSGHGTKQINPALQGELRSDVQKLYELALELKKQMDSTDVNSVLSVDIVKKAQQIEKLAKRVKEHAKG